MIQQHQQQVALLIKCCHPPYGALWFTLLFFNTSLNNMCGRHNGSRDRQEPLERLLSCLIHAVVLLLVPWLSTSVRYNRFSITVEGTQRALGADNHWLLAYRERGSVAEHGWPLATGVQGVCFLWLGMDSHWLLVYSMDGHWLLVYSMDGHWLLVL